MHAYVCAFMHPSMHACVRACVLACVRPCVRPCVRASVRMCMRACVRACLYVCMHLYVSVCVLLQNPVACLPCESSAVRLHSMRMHVNLSMTLAQLVLKLVKTQRRRPETTTDTENFTWSPPALPVPITSDRSGGNLAKKRARLRKSACVKVGGSSTGYLSRPQTNFCRPSLKS